MRLGLYTSNTSGNRVTNTKNKMYTETQIRRVVSVLEEKGEVNNFWAFHNYILRLGAIIYVLRQRGWEIHGQFGKQKGLGRKFWKNYYYSVVSAPKKGK